MPPLRIFIGYDPRQRIAFHILNQSITEHSSVPVSVTALRLEQLPISRAGLTPFTWSRFLVPWLCEFKGMALFLDADILCVADIAELFGHAVPGAAVNIVENPFAKFERAAIMLFDCEHPANACLTPEFVETSKQPLHQIGWVPDDQIGRLPKSWGHTVFYDEPNAHPKMIHYTAGVPLFPETMRCEHAQAYAEEVARMSRIASWSALMGNSVHVARVQKHLREIAAEGPEQEYAAPV